MKAFEHISVGSVGEAVAFLGEQRDPGPHKIIAGGTDLLTLMKGGLISPRRLINLCPPVAYAICALQRMVRHIGALTTLADLERSGEIALRLPDLAPESARGCNATASRNGDVGWKSAATSTLLVFSKRTHPAGSITPVAKSSPHTTPSFLGVAAISSPCGRPDGQKYFHVTGTLSQRRAECSVGLTQKPCPGSPDTGLCMGIGCVGATVQSRAGCAMRDNRASAVTAASSRTTGRVAARSATVRGFRSSAAGEQSSSREPVAGWARRQVGTKPRGLFDAPLGWLSGGSSHLGAGQRARRDEEHQGGRVAADGGEGE